MKCAAMPAAQFRPCSEPLPEEARGRDPILGYQDREVVISRRNHTKLMCGKLVAADATRIVLEPIEKPMPLAYNGGECPRDEVERIQLILDSWRQTEQAPPPYSV